MIKTAFVSILTISIFAAACSAPPSPAKAPVKAPPARRSATLHPTNVGMRAKQAMKNVPIDDGKKAQAETLLTYHGGPVIAHVKLHTLFWNADTANQSALNTFYTDIVNSPYMDWLAEYSTSTQSIGRGQFIGSTLDTSPPSGSSFSDDDVATEIDRLIDAGSLPEPDADTLYMVHFPSYVTVYLGSSPSCSSWLAYHSTYIRNGREVPYGVMPDCYDGDFSSTTSVTGHELIESITDPGVGEKDLDWYDDNLSDGEIGDICEPDAGTVDGYTVALGWSNTLGACVSHNPDVNPNPNPGPNLVANGDFEAGDGLPSWTSSGVTFARTYQPYDGSTCARVGSLYPYDGDSALAQAISVPATGTTTLSFVYNANCPDTIDYDQMRAEIRDAAGNTLRSIFNRCDETDWLTETADLTPFAGQTVTLWFGVHDDDGPSDPTFLLVDDVSVTNR
jgi:hypothetical protein